MVARRTVSPVMRIVWLVLAAMLTMPLPSAAAEPPPPASDEFDLTFAVPFRPQRQTGQAPTWSTGASADIERLMADLLRTSECVGSLTVRGSYAGNVTDTIEQTDITFELPQFCVADDLYVRTEVADFGLPIGAQKVAREATANPPGVTLAEAGTGQSVPVASAEHGAHGLGSRLEWTFIAFGTLPGSSGPLYGELCIVATAFNGGKINVYTHSCAEFN